MSEHAPVGSQRKRTPQAAHRPPFAFWLAAVIVTLAACGGSSGGRPSAGVPAFTTLAPSYAVMVSMEGLGTVTREPDLAMYEEGSTVTLVASPNGGTFAGWTGDIESDESTITVEVDSEINLTATFDEPAPGPFVSDDFDSASLGSHWRLVDPSGDATIDLTGAGTDDATLELSTPLGTHDPWNANGAVRLLQPVENVDRLLEVAFESTPSERFQVQGLMFEQDDDNWLRVDLFHDGSQLHAFAGTTVEGTSTAALDVVVPTDTRFLAVERVADAWSVKTSADGVTWTTAGVFGHPMRTAWAGVFVGNSGESTEFSTVVDYVIDAAAPLDQEDGAPFGAPDGVAASRLLPLVVTVSGGGAVFPDPDQGAYAPGSVVTLNAVPEEGFQFIGWTGSIESFQPSETVVMDGEKRVTATFRKIRLGPGGIDLWFGPTQRFGANGATQAWVNVLGNAWDPDEVRSLAYRLNGGESMGLSIGPDRRRLQDPGDFNVEIPTTSLFPGSNTVVISMTDRLGNVVSETVEVIWEPVPVELPHTVEWADAAAVGDVAQVVDGNWSIVDGQARTTSTGYDRLLAVGDQSWTNYEIEVPVTIHAIGPGAGAPLSGPALVGFGLNWIGHSLTGTQPNWGFTPTGAFAWYTLDRGGRLVVQTSAEADYLGRTLELGKTYRFKARVEQIAATTQYSFKVWPDGGDEPDEWTNQAIGTEAPMAGSIVLIAHHADVSFGDVKVTPIR